MVSLTGYERKQYKHTLTILILIAFPLQQWLRERVSLLRYACCACLIQIYLYSDNSSIWRYNPCMWLGIGKSIRTHVIFTPRIWFLWRIIQDGLLGLKICTETPSQKPVLCTTGRCVLLPKTYVFMNKSVRIWDLLQQGCYTMLDRREECRQTMLANCILKWLVVRNWAGVGDTKLEKTA